MQFNGHMPVTLCHRHVSNRVRFSADVFDCMDRCVSAVRRRIRMRVRRADAVRLVATGVVAVASTVTAREAQERHRSHAGGTQNHAEYVEVHLSAHVVREFSSAKR